jgi:3-keto-disaccharide hydrolase
MVRKLRYLQTVMLTFATMLLPALAVADNTLTEQEMQEGWQLLFNGEDMSQWRNFKQPDLNEKWVVENGVMTLTGRGGGDIMTKASYRNFDLRLDWKISEGGNSGIFILVDEEGKRIYSHAPEIQILDNERHSDRKIDSHRSGSLYDMVSSHPSSHKRAGEWNQVRILFRDRFLQVWQNGVMTVNIDMNSTTWETLLEESKFDNWKGFGEASEGHIGLQDHSDPVSFKNIKIKEL